MLDAAIVRQVWSVIVDLHGPEILYLPDAALMAFLLQQIARHIFLSNEEIGRLQSYLNAKLPLIRDMADGGAAI
jgi:hypothetical protein